MFKRRAPNLQLPSKIMLSLLTLTLLSLLGATVASAATERSYLNAWCDGVTEFQLLDRTRVDCLTDKRAVEFDFDKKWAESLAQSLHYAGMTGKRAGVVLIARGSNAEKHYKALETIINANNLPVDLCLIDKAGGFLQATQRHGWCLHRTLAQEVRADCAGCHAGINGVDRAANLP